MIYDISIVYSLAQLEEIQLIHTNLGHFNISAAQRDPACKNLKRAFSKTIAEH